MRRRHPMPFGAELQPDGAVRFRLWAPSAQRVAVDVDGVSLPLAAQGEGWFELATDRAGPGSCYEFVIDGAQRVPDPASRHQPRDVHGPSRVIDPLEWEWQDDQWRGRPWAETVLYEVHVGTFTPEGGYAGVIDRLDYLAGMGVTALELMPVADFPGRRNWGYDGVFLFAPDTAYGHPHDLKRLVDCAHAKGLMVFLDVVYNHFGPEGNYLHQYAPLFFTERHHTPWGAAINYDGPGSGAVRDFVIHNALYWLEEYHFDGLRLDAVHAILDDSRPDILTELAERVHAGPGAGRHVHLVLENDDNAARYLGRDEAGRPRGYAAQWNDDIHHALHVLLTGEDGGYYQDYADRPARHLGRCLAEGFAYQGEASPYREGRQRGESSAHLAPGAFVAFLQNHDQVGNRAFGERIGCLADAEAVRAATAVVLLAPQIPLLFMGEEWQAGQPFQFFCDFGADIAGAVTEGRRREFSGFEQFRDPALLADIPDPNDAATFRASVLDWTESDSEAGRGWRDLHRRLLALRREHIVPRLAAVRAGAYRLAGDAGLEAAWPLAGGGRLVMTANMGATALEGLQVPGVEPIYATHPGTAGRTLPPWFVAWSLCP